jgi:hypothetical protein
MALSDNYLCKIAGRIIGLGIRSMDAAVQWGFSLSLYLLHKGGYSLSTECKQGNIISRQGGRQGGKVTKMLIWEDN